MNQRYGGKYSPGGAPKGDTPEAPARPRVPARRSKIGARVNLLFFLPLPMAITAFGKDPTGLALSLVAFGMMIAAAWLLREGLKAEEAYESRKVARRPAFPRKIFASVLTGLGLGLAGYANGVGIPAVALFAILGSILHSLAFGLDPLSDKGAEGIDMFQTDRVARAVEQAEEHLSAMTDAIRRVEDRGLEREVEAFQATARDMFRRVEEDPRDLTAARKYLSVYLQGARDATIKFADLYSRRPDAQARSDYTALLHDLSANFTAQTDAMLLDDRSDLDVEIEVLQDRLAREGVRIKS